MVLRVSPLSLSFCRPFFRRVVQSGIVSLLIVSVRKILALIDHARVKLLRRFQGTAIHTENCV